MDSDGTAFEITTAPGERKREISVKEFNEINNMKAGDGENREKQATQQKALFLLDRETEELDQGMENKNTLRKTDTDVRIVIAYLKSIRETRPPELISPIELDKYLTSFFGTVRKHDGNEYEPASLRGMLCSIERHLKMKNYPASVTRDFIFANTRQALRSKQQKLREHGKGAKKLSENYRSLSFDKINDLYDAKEMGPYTPMSIINTLCFTIIVHFRLRKAIDHKNLLWGDIKLKYDQSGKEYLRYEPISTLQPRSLRKIATKGGKICILPTSLKAEKDPISIYKLYAEKRPSNLNYENAPFYLGITTMYPSSMQAWYRTCAMGVNKLSELVRMIREITGLSKVPVDYPIKLPLTNEYSKIQINPPVELQGTTLEDSLDRKAVEQNGISLPHRKPSNRDQDTEDSSSNLSLSNDDDDEDIWEDESMSKSSEEVNVSNHTSLNMAKTYFSQMIQRLDNSDVIKFREWLAQVEICTDPIRGHGICREKFGDKIVNNFEKTSDGSDLVKVEKKIDAKPEDLSSARITLNITLSPRSLLGKGPITVTATSNKDLKQTTGQVGTQNDSNKKEKITPDPGQATGGSPNGLSPLMGKRSRSMDSTPMNLVCRQKYPRNHLYNGGQFDLFQHGLTAAALNLNQSTINQGHNTFNRILASAVPPLAHCPSNRVYQREPVAVSSESLSCSRQQPPSAILTDMPKSINRVHDEETSSLICPPRTDVDISSQTVSISCNISSNKH
ncbi:hypothetical protein FSP39_007218 [Pinctada imbricata]|uniref:ZMYM2-like/QRICH1 C-terminal domain-containing protein n=1 Tax=Pinctada imbricata TaxID=66713 RepID=A0AA89BWP7_PINIB|nr:hypothetical protein FSP39_007218 [Pinctada imbricata]